MFSLFYKNKFSIKRFTLKTVAYILIWVLFVYVIYSLLFGLLAKYENVDIYDYCNFDVKVFSPNAEYYNEIIAEQDFVKCSLRCINTGGDILHNGEYGTTTTLNIDAENFDDLFKIFPRNLFIEIDDLLLKRQDGIFLDFSIAKHKGIKVGDYVAVSGREKVVVGIYENAITNIIHCNSITLADKKMYEQVGDMWDGFYNDVFIRVSDINIAKKYFEENYFRHLDYIETIVGQGQEKGYQEEYGENWISKTILAVEDDNSQIKDYKKNAFIPRNTLKAYAINDYKLNYNLNEDIAYSIVSIVAVFSICILESYRHAKENQQKIAILRMMGASRYSISSFYFTRSFILQTVLMLLGITFVKCMTSQNRYISNTLTVQWIVYFEIVIFAAALISTIVSVRKLSDKALLFSLNEEGSVD